jgi:hypothetical protein
MKKIVYSLIAVLIVSATYYGCKKKYPEGPAISLRPALRRLTGIFEIENIYANGVNRNEIIDTLNLGTYEIIYIKNTSIVSGCKGCPYGRITLKDINGEQMRYFIWEENDNITELSISFGTLLNSPYDTLNKIYGIPCMTDTIYDDEIWTIIKLKQNTLWLKTQYQGTEYEVHLNKTEDIEPD